MKRKAETHREKVKRKKHERYRREHMYDSEQAYWKNASKQATREAKTGIQSLFEGSGLAGGLAAAGSGVYRAGAAANSILQSAYMPAIVDAVGTEALGVAMAGAGTLVSGAIPLIAGAGVLTGQAVGSLFAQTNSNQVVEALMPGTYQGKIALSARATFKGLRDKFQKRGSVYIVENYGAVSDPDLVYIGHSTFNFGCAINAIGIALLRKLFRVGIKLDPQTQYEELPLISVVPDSGPQGFEIVYETRDSDGTQNRYTHTIANDSSLETILNQLQGGFSLYSNIEEGMTAQNPKVLEKVYLYQKNNANADARLQYQMDMLKEVLTIAMSSHMTIQNRTKAAADGSSSTTQVDVQPLKGSVFEFSVGVPKVKATTPIALASMESGGLLLVRAGQFGGTDVTAYKEPPVKKAFQNVVKSAYVRLNPGALKSMAIGADLRGYYQTVLFKLRFNADSTQLKRCYGKSQMACFEEELNSGSTNKITVQYECQHIAGADFKTTNSPNMQPGYAAGQINNIPA